MDSSLDIDTLSEISVIGYIVGRGNKTWMWSFRTLLLLFVNTTAGLTLLALLLDLQHLNDLTVPPYLQNAGLTTALAEHTQRVATRATTARLYHIFKTVVTTIAVNIIIRMDLVASLWTRVMQRFSGKSLQSAVFHSSWSFFTLTLYEYADVRLFSTWILTVAGSGLAALDPTSSRQYWWTLLVMLLGVVVWFISGYLVTSLKPQWRAAVFPILTLILLVQVAYDLGVEPDLVYKTSTPLPAGPVLSAVSSVALRCDFPVANVRFRMGRVGAGQTFGIYQNIVVLSGPDVDVLHPDEWAALAAREFGHWYYRDVITRVLLRLGLRFLWAPVALWLMTLDSFFPPFGLSVEPPLVVAFAVTELFAVQFDWMFHRFIGWIERLMEYRADQYAVQLVVQDVYVRAILKAAWVNEVPLSSARLYRYLISGVNSPYSRIRHFLE
ncbi:STE24 endopeptidase [Paramicrosporidium saccamoebae]|uniref:STE24 endopeptidase n=1 Tax=Paramicrosporidium saccamoebae TaxID=1246581 RepID=A0A2H9TI19_9FUNG|nr:STE24 endopeptidase [Paramicrosporidium saccamoebae]